jgi:hypothetical protein
MTLVWIPVKIEEFKDFGSVGFLFLLLEEEFVYVSDFFVFILGSFLLEGDEGGNYVRYVSQLRLIYERRYL